MPQFQARKQKCHFCVEFKTFKRKQWEEKAKDLAGRFIKNFAKFTGNEAGKALVAAGPKL